jgi:2-amino-4-hydroxy-6-hydroxymethyldihydropteridine diphosphokinase
LTERAFISLGSNIGPETYLPRAVEQLGTLGRVVAVSRVYQSAAIAPDPQPDFLNAAVLLRTAADPFDVRTALRNIETTLGRVRSADKNAPRTIDLDLCLYADRVLCTSDLVLPAPEIVDRAYLAVTLAELAPDFRHPVNGESLRTIANRLRPSARLVLRADVVLPVPLPEQQV